MYTVTKEVAQLPLFMYVCFFFWKIAELNCGIILIKTNCRINLMISRLIENNTVYMFMLLKSTNHQNIIKFYSRKLIKNLMTFAFHRKLVYITFFDHPDIYKVSISLSWFTYFISFLVYYTEIKWIFFTRYFYILKNPSVIRGKKFFSIRFFFEFWSSKLTNKCWWKFINYL